MLNLTSNKTIAESECSYRSSYPLRFYWERDIEQYLNLVSNLPWPLLCTFK